MPTSNEIAEIVNGALRRLEQSTGYAAIDFQGDFLDPNDENFDENDFELLLDQEVVLCLPRCDVDGITLTYGELDDFSREIAGARLHQNLECWTPRRCFVRVEHFGTYEGYLKLEAWMGKERPLHTVSLSKCTYSLNFATGTTPFGFMVAKQGIWEKDFPPVLGEDSFIEVQWTGDKNDDVLRRIVDGFIFELASSHEVFLRRSPRPDYDYDELHQANVQTPREFRPILHGSGVTDALNLYSLAIATEDPGFQIIGFVKVLEHISATVVREDLVNAVRAKLLSSRALDPNAEFILELESAIASHTRQHRKDSDALRLTIQKCCDATELSKHSPDFLSLSRVNTSTKDKDRTSALSEMSGAVSATRNQIVHAKLNYEKTGEECPPESVHQLATLCRVAAEQAVRWYAIQHESVRVVGTP